MPTLEARKPTSIIYETETRLVSDTSCMLLEELEAPLEERISVAFLSKDRGGRLIDPETGKPIANMLAENNIVDRQEKQAFLKTENNTGDPRIVDIWISPPNPSRSKETRINVSVTYQGIDLINLLPNITKTLKNKDGALQRILTNKNIVVLYAFPNNFSPLECLYIAQKIISCSTLDNPKITNPEQLRITPLVFQSNSNSWGQTLLDLGIISDKQLEKVLSGEVFSAREKSKVVAEVLKDEFKDRYLKAGEDVGKRTLVVNQIRERAQDFGYKLNPASQTCPRVGRGSFDIYYQLTSTVVDFRLLTAEQQADKYHYSEKGICVDCKEFTLICPPPEGCCVCRKCTIKANLKESIPNL